MTWVKLSDDALDDPKVADLAPGAIVAYLRALGWSNRWARDGMVPQSLAGDAAGVWISAGLAKETEYGVQLVWQLEHQPKADEIEKRKTLAAERQERHRRHMAGDHSKCDPKRCHVLLKLNGKGVTRDTTRDKRPLRPVSDPSRPEGRGEERTDPDGIALEGEPPARRECSQCGRGFLGPGYEDNPDEALCSAKCRMASDTAALRSIAGGVQ